MSLETFDNLARQECIPCRGGVSPLEGESLRQIHLDLGRDWQVIDEHHLGKEFRFPDFRAALEFTNRVGELAEQQGHHPDIYLSWGLVRVQIWTHKIDGLSESDFILAAKADRLT